jgi:hypothetical protein
VPAFPADIDACVTNPCKTPFGICQDKSAAAGFLGDVAGRECRCPNAYQAYNETAGCYGESPTQLSLSASCLSQAVSKHQNLTNTWSRCSLREVLCWPRSHCVGHNGSCHVTEDGIGLGVCQVMSDFGRLWSDYCYIQDITLHA